MANLFYSKGTKEKYRDIRPNDLFQMYEEAKRKLGYRVLEHECEYCRGQGMISVKRYVVGVGTLDYAYRCFCSNGSKVSEHLEQMQPSDISDYEQIQRIPARFIDVHMWKDGKKTDELVTNDIVKEAKTKRYSKEKIEAFKERMRNTD
jgi:uncharacterized damage-inducible protein DinB